MIQSAPARVLWSDERLVALSKPAGVSLATPARDPHGAVVRLLAAVPPAEREAHGLRPDALLLVHRLDRGTTGVVLLARDEDRHRELQRQLELRTIEKIYYALTWGTPRPPEGQFDAPLGPDRADRRKMRVDPNGRPAWTLYRVRGKGAYAALVELRAKTGRTHQLRVHLAAAGHPIVGDDLYAGPRHHGVREPQLKAALAPPHLLLHAWRVILPAGPGAAELIITAPFPTAFETALAALAIEI